MYIARCLRGSTTLMKSGFIMVSSRCSCAGRGRDSKLFRIVCTELVCPTRPFSHNPTAATLNQTSIMDWKTSLMDIFVLPHRRMLPRRMTSILTRRQTTILATDVWVTGATRVIGSHPTEEMGTDRQLEGKAFSGKCRRNTLEQRTLLCEHSGVNKKLAHPGHWRGTTGLQNHRRHEEHRTQPRINEVLAAIAELLLASAWTYENYLVEGRDGMGVCIHDDALNGTDIGPPFLSA